LAGGCVEIVDPCEPRVRVIGDVGGVQWTDEPRADEAELDHSAESRNMPTAARSRRNCTGSRKWMPWMPRADAAAALRGSSSMNTADSGATPLRVSRTWKIRGSGLITRSSPEMTMSRNHARNPKRSRIGANVSADQFEIA